MKSYLHHILIALLAVISFNFNIIGQSDSLKEENKEAKVEYYKVDEIPKFYTSQSIQLKSIVESIATSGKYVELKDRVPVIKNNFNQLYALTDKLDLKKEYPETLFEFFRLWDRQKSEISKWNDEVADRTEFLLSEKKLLQEALIVWKATDTTSVNATAPFELKQKTRSLIREIEKAISKIESEIGRLLVLQNSLADQDVQSELMSRKVEEQYISGKRELLNKNAPAFWELEFWAEGAGTLFQPLLGIADSFINAATLLYLKNAGSFPVSLIYSFLLVLFLIYTIKYSRTLSVDDSRLNRIMLMFGVPVSTIAFLIFIQILFSSQDIPRIFLNIIKILALIPMVRIFAKLVDPAYKKSLYYISFLVVLQQFKVTMGSGTSLERMFLTVIIILSLIMFNYIKLDNGIKKGTNQYTPIVIKTINLLTILFALAFIADVFGYVMLSLTIVDGVLSSLFGLSTLYILAQMIEGILLVLLQTDFAKRSNIIRDHSELVKQKIHKIIKILFYILAVSSVLRSFGLLIILGNFLEELFGNNITVGTFSLNIGTVVLFFFSIWFAVTIARSIRFILETDILVRMNLKRGVAGAVSSMTLYAITGFGIVFAIMSSGLDLNSFSLLAGALGVGIGFGLQDIVRNFISGIILIFERPVQIGDAVEVEELSGVIRKIGIRSSVIKTWEGAEVIVPNGNLISNKLINWTFSDHQKRLEIKVGVAYGSDVQKVIKLLHDCTKGNEEILLNPAPSVFFKDFADSALLFELRCWTENFNSWLQIQSDLRVEIEKVLRENGIEIPFPQTDVHIKSGDLIPAKKTK